MWIDFPLTMYRVSAFITLQLILSGSELVEDRLTYFKSEFQVGCHEGDSSFICVTYMIELVSVASQWVSSSLLNSLERLLFHTISHILWSENYVAERGGGKTAGLQHVSQRCENITFPATENNPGYKCQEMFKELRQDSGKPEHLPAKDHSQGSICPWLSQLALQELWKGDISLRFSIPHPTLYEHSTTN